MVRVDIIVAVVPGENQNLCFQRFLAGMSSSRSDDVIPCVCPSVCGSWVEGVEAFIEVTKLIEAISFLFHFISYVW